MNSPTPSDKLPNQPLPSDRPTPALDPVLETVASPRRLPGWRFWLPLLVQSALIIAVPAQDAYTYATGRTVVLQTAPVDPYDFLRGYYQTLGYEVSQLDKLSKLPGGEHLKTNPVGEVYVILEAPSAKDSRPPQPWKPVRISGERPSNLPDNQIALKGRAEGWRVVYGLETYYMPEDQREQVNAAINQAQQGNQRSFVVEAKVDASGNSVPVSLWVRDRNYKF
ncbi:putative membrane-anchored protein [Leptolyngbyaceae cyanobacterium JSC-12]|nr:putative membrane-anchored protein [Leptolyngbyaceae cyanobacterium JSC-12]